MKQRHACSSGRASLFVRATTARRRGVNSAVYQSCVSTTAQTESNKQEMAQDSPRLPVHR